MLYLGNVLLHVCYVLIYNLEVSFNYHLTFLHYALKTVFFFLVLPGIFFEVPITQTPDDLNLFQFRLKVRVIGSRLYFLTNG